MKTEHVAFILDSVPDETVVAAVTEALTRMNGVFEVFVDADSRRIAVEYDAERMDLAVLRGTIEDVGCRVR